MRNLEGGDLIDEIQRLINDFGPSKSMDFDALCNQKCYFLLRKFLGLNDLLIIFKAGKCPYSCNFCNLNNRNTDDDIDVLSQFLFVCNEIKHALSIIERVTLSNNNSVLNNQCLDFKCLLSIIKSMERLKNLREIVLETNMLYVSSSNLIEIKRNTTKMINVLAGFETLNNDIRIKVLNKPESIDRFLVGLDDLSEARCALTSYLLYKPDYHMSDADAYEEAMNSILFLDKETKRRNIPFSLRINPMYAVKGTRWGEAANACSLYEPPKLSDVLKIASFSKSLGISTYIGLSTENSNELYGCFRNREDFSKELLKSAILFNLGC